MIKKRNHGKLFSFLANIPLPSTVAATSGGKRFLGHIFGNMHWWQIFLIIAGFLAIIFVILALFFNFGDSTKNQWSSEIHPVDSQEFIQALAHLSNAPIGHGGDVKILKNGDEFMPEFLDTVKNAQYSINFTAYIWEKGSMSDQIIAAFKERAAAGVEIRILLDGFGGNKAPTDKMDELKKLGVRIEKFRPAKFGKFSRIDKRDHRRAIIIDGQVGFMGGMAVADHWLGNGMDPLHWRDDMFEVHGVMAQSIQSAFVELWAGTTGEILEGSKFYPLVTKDASAQSTYVNLVSSPAADTQPVPKFFWLSMASAQKNIYLNSPYFVPDVHIRTVLMEKAKAGVDVRVLVPNKYNDAKPIRLASQKYYEELLQAGVKIYEYQPSMIHAKVLVIDGLWSVIGSANMDSRSVQLNEEYIMGIQNPILAKQLAQIFNDDLTHSKQIMLDEWKKRGLFQRIGESLFVNFAKQY